jgi:hypothetical protein
MSCEKSTFNPNFVGSWIEVSEKLDTITFTRFLSENALQLDRGYKNVESGPIPLGGKYFCIFLESDSLAINSIYSSFCPMPDTNCYPRYYFKSINENSFAIGNFYNSAKGSEIIFTYSRLD